MLPRRESVRQRINFDLRSGVQRATKNGGLSAAVQALDRELVELIGIEPTTS